MAKKMVERDAEHRERDAEYFKLIQKDLKKSALPPKAEEIFFLNYVSPEETRHLCNHEVPSLCIPYFDPDGTERDFARLKYLLPPPKNSWTTKDSVGKYWQEPNSVSQLYFPPLCNVPKARWSWPTVLSDPSVPLYITEGEKKAMCGVWHGLPMVAISGVNNWRSSKRFNQHVIPDIDLIDFDGRTVYLSFDADVIGNPQVGKALADLSAELTHRGCRSVRIVELPSNTTLGPKIGLDDYIKLEGFAAYQQLVNDAKDVKRTKALWDLNDRFAFVQTMAAVYDTHLRAWHKRSAFFDLTAPLTITQMTLTANGSARITEEPANKYWWEWSSRREFERHRYAPGLASVIDSGTTLNTWTGWGTSPILADADPFLLLLQTLTENLSEKERRWFLQWLAWPIQHPAEGKQATAVLVHSATQGSGKSFLGEIMADMYGKNAVYVSSPDQMFYNHASYFETAQFVVADEVLVGTRAEVDRIKNFITSPALWINPKGLPAYEAQSYINWYLTSNHSDALKISVDDRRWFIIHAPERKLPVELIERIRRWRAAGGVGAAMRYLMDVNLSDYQPWQAAPQTLAKESMADAARSETERWCQTLQFDPDSILQVDGVPLSGDLFTERDWHERGILPPRVNSTTVRKELLALGFERRTRLISRHWKGSERTLWCLRNRDYWSTATNGDWCDAYNAYLNQRGVLRRSAINEAVAAKGGDRVSPLVRRTKEKGRGS